MTFSDWWERKKKFPWRDDNLRYLAEAAFKAGERSVNAYLLEACKSVLKNENYQGTGEPWPHLFEIVRAAVERAEPKETP